MRFERFLFKLIQKCIRLSTRHRDLLGRRDNCDMRKIYQKRYRTKCEHYLLL